MMEGSGSDGGELLGGVLGGVLGGGVLGGGVAGGASPSGETDGDPCCEPPLEDVLVRVPDEPLDGGSTGGGGGNSNLLVSPLSMRVMEHVAKSLR